VTNGVGCWEPLRARRPMCIEDTHPTICPFALHTISGRSERWRISFATFRGSRMHVGPPLRPVTKCSRRNSQNSVILVGGSNMAALSPLGGFTAGTVAAVSLVGGLSNTSWDGPTRELIKYDVRDGLGATSQKRGDGCDGCDGVVIYFLSVYIS